MNNLLFFPKDHFKKDTQRPLTPLMIKTLKSACEKQKQGVLFGPQDIKGSMITLINRGLIARNIPDRKTKIQTGWCVTQQAVNMLADAGIKILC